MQLLQNKLMKKIEECILSNLQSVESLSVHGFHSSREEEKKRLQLTRNYSYNETMDDWKWMDS